MFIVSSTQIDKKIVRTEIGVLLRLSHPNIVRYLSNLWYRYLCNLCDYITLFTLLGNISHSLYSVRIWMSSFWRDCSHFVFFQIRLKEIFETETEIFLILELVTGGELFDRYDVLHKWKAVQLWNRISDIHCHLKIVHSKKWEICHHILTLILLQNCMAFFLLQKEDILKNVLLVHAMKVNGVQNNTEKTTFTVKNYQCFSIINLQVYLIIYY